MVFEVKPLIQKPYPPPRPSTPREAPWREVEEIIDELKKITSKLEQLIEVIVNLTPGGGGGVVPNKRTWRHGQTDVTTAGTPEQLDDFPVPDGFAVTVIARTGNTGNVYLGRGKLECAASKQRFDGLSAGLADSKKVQNVNAIWVDADVDGEGVSWSVESDT